ncbi:MAG: D-glycerate dehydrogenase [Deltaproteobacteria bacterium]|nr:D-glycerate dehydrogenase [Deltaproteobacteria bacterium]
MDKVLITRRLPQAGLDPLAERTQLIVSPHDRPLTPDELREMSAGCRALGATLGDRIDEAFLAARPEIEIVANYAVGVDNIDLEATGRRRVVVTNTPDVLTEATADLALALILALTRRVVEGDRLLRRGEFFGIAPLFMLGDDLAGQTLGIFGLGRIGRAVAKRGLVFGLRIIYHNRRPDPQAAKELGAEYVSFDELLTRSDVLSINAPLTDETRGVFDYETLGRMQPTASLINTGRGPIVREADLAKALKEGLIKGAALDVYEHEPQVHPELIPLPNVVLAPHLGSATIGVREKMARLVAQNIITYLDGLDPPHRVI